MSQIKTGIDSGYEDRIHSKISMFVMDAMNTDVLSTKQHLARMATVDFVASKVPSFERLANG
jgi:hypothetical protein